MARRQSYTPETIIMKLREAEILLSQGHTVKEVSRRLEISEQTYYRWRESTGAWMYLKPKSSKNWKKKTPG
jgi:transposase-like protein